MNVKQFEESIISLMLANMNEKQFHESMISLMTLKQKRKAYDSFMVGMLGNLLLTTFLHLTNHTSLSIILFLLFTFVFLYIFKVKLTNIRKKEATLKEKVDSLLSLSFNKKQN